jgi:hypothetical protein
VHLSVAHQLDAGEAKATVEKAFDHYRHRYAKYKPSLRWLDHHRAEVAFVAKGVTLTGTLRLESGRIVMDAKVPFLLRPFTKKAVAVVERELGRWVGEGAAISGDGLG